MVDTASELRHLASAAQCIHLGESCIARLETCLRRLEDAGRDPREAVATLRGLHDTMDRFKERRLEILRDLAYG